MSTDDSIDNVCCTDNGSQGGSDASAQMAGERCYYSVIGFWTLAWLGTTASGGLFGVLVGGVAGLLGGSILAGVVGIPIHITMATITWLLWLSRFSVAMSGLAGALTGIAATLIIWETFVPLPLVLAGSIGAAGAAASSGLYRIRSSRRSHAQSIQTEPRCQFSLLNLFVRVTVVAGLLVGWTWLCVSIHDAHAPVSEEELKSIFQNHRIEFNRLVLMFRKDEKLHWIYGDGSYDRKVIDQHRGEEYLALLRRARLNNSTIHSSFDEHVSRIEIFPKSAFRGGVVLGYIYTTIEPKGLVDRLADVNIVELERGKSLHANIGGHWYLFIRRPDFND